jgi:tetratricopeptide (TPR) repeat protein
MTAVARACPRLVVGLVAAVLSASIVLATSPAHAAEPVDANSPEVAARTAFEHEPTNAYLGRSLLDLLVRNGKLDDARKLSADLTARFPDDAQLWSQIGYLMFMLRDFKQAAAAFVHALEGKDWTPEQRRNLAFAAANSAVEAKDPPGAVAALQMLGPTTDPALRLRLGRAQLAAHDRWGAVMTARWILANVTDEEFLIAAEHLRDTAFVPVEDAAGNKALNLGYAYLRQGDDAAGLASFEKGFSYGSGKAFHYADAAYAAKRLNANATASKYFRFCLDLAEFENSFTEQRMYGYRREIEVMERRWGMLIGTPYHAGALDVWQGGIEAYWQPPVIGYRDGKTVQLFVRSYLNFRNGIGGPTGLSTTQETIGVRFKPLASQNIAFTAERLFAVGRNSDNDWLFRIGYSTGDGTDLRVDRAKWQSWQVYGEAAYYWNARRMLIGSEVRWGLAIPQPGWTRLTYYPHFLLAVDYDSAAKDELVDAIGPGFSLRAWFGEDKYRAPPCWLEVNAQYRFADSDRGRGPALRATLSF